MRSNNRYFPPTTKHSDEARVIIDASIRTPLVPHTYSTMITGAGILLLWNQSGVWTSLWASSLSCRAHWVSMATAARTRTQLFFFFLAQFKDTIKGDVALKTKRPSYVSAPHLLCAMTCVLVSWGDYRSALWCLLLCSLLIANHDLQCSAVVLSNVYPKYNILLFKSNAR